MLNLLYFVMLNLFPSPRHAELVSASAFRIINNPKTGSEWPLAAKAATILLFRA